MKKIISLFIFFITMISPVLANEISLVKEKIDDTYTLYYDPGLERYRYLYAQKFLLGDNIGYCLEIGKSINTNIYKYSTSFDSLKIDENTLEEIKLISYYGYDYPGHNTDKYYMATQELIWQKISNPKISWILEMDESKTVDISKEIKEIRSLVESHYKKPSFDNAEIKYSIGKEKVIEDTNNVLNRYITNNKNVLIEGNKLILTKDFNEEEIMLTKPNYTDKKFFLYTYGSAQKLMSAGSVESVESTIKIKLIGGSLELTKLDKDTKSKIAQGESSLEGAIYELYNEDNVLVDTIITGSKNKIDNLPLGKYTIKEKTPSVGYKLDSTIYNIEITEETPNIKLDVYEEVIKRKIELFKVFASNETGHLKGEENISFEIYNKDKLLVDTITTDKEGYVVIELPYGTYTFKQKNSTKNYYKLEDFTVEILEYNEKPIHKLLSNSQITAKVKIIKKDLETKENIINSNIKFKIFDVTNNEYLSLKVSYPENKETTEFMVDKNGIFITPVPLSSGKYTLEEVKESMNGYIHNKEKITFEIGENTNLIEEDGELYLEIPFYNKRVKGEMNITKYGEEILYENNSYKYKEIQLEGVIFELYAKENIYENGKLKYKKDQIIKELTTDKDGNITINNLPLGEYYLKEIKTVNNHILDNKIYNINLEYKDETTEVITHNLDIKNYLRKGKIIINKYETGTTNKIPNTLIEIHTIDNKVIYKGYTDKDGKIEIKDLPYGNYYLSEVEASTGYRLLEDKIAFEINKDEEIINIYNERIKVPNTGYKLNALDIYVLTLTIIGIILIIIFPKEKKVILISILTILLALSYLIIKIYNYYNDNKQNQLSVEAYINKEIEVIEEEKYKYQKILEIPSINLKRGILDINNKYNDAKYNIELIKEDEQSIVLAAHNGNNQNSYFKNLKNLNLNDQILYYEDGKLYNYTYSDSYDIKKDGYADIYRKDDKKSIILITCKDNTDNAQTVHIGYLKEITTY